MVFSSITFVLVFLPLVLFIYLLSNFLLPQRIKLKILNALLLIFSLIFYAWGSLLYIHLLFISIILNYFVALKIKNSYDNIGKYSAKKWLCFGVAINLIILIFYKYSYLFISSMNVPFINEIIPLSGTLEYLKKLVLPLGISFFTFQAISYLIDVYRKEVDASLSVLDFGCYLIMFPQLVAGPIVRYADIKISLSNRIISFENFASGGTRFIYGLAKKILIADTCGRVADAAFSIPNDHVSSLVAWSGMICYTFQIYFDFSGYSDMAIGLGRIFGFSFPENFNYPYISRSITEFWRRWHMTLSRWFRDYLYIPLGGNRKGNIRTCINLIIVFMLCGFWHGAEWIFLIWGLYHGLFLVIERFFKNIPNSLPRALQHIYTISIFMFGWVIFRSSDFAQLRAFSNAIFSYVPMTSESFRVCIPLFSTDLYLAILFAILFSMPTFNFLREKIIDFSERYSLLPLTYSIYYLYSLALLLICFMPLYGSTYNAFIYFRF